VASWVLARDRITVGPALDELVAAETRVGHIAPGDELIFLAREVMQSETWRVPDGHSVLIATDRYVTAGSWSPFGAPVAPTLGIDARGTAGTLGARGAAGADGSASVSGSKPGKPGGPGGAGTDGTAGRSLALFARTLFPVMLNGAGGAGGSGGIGGRGGDGVRGRRVPKTGEFIDGSNGGDGGPGGSGASGGAGGDVRIVYVDPAAVTVSVSGASQPSTNGTGGSAEPASNGAAPSVPIPLVFDPAWAKGGPAGAGGPGGSPGSSFLDPIEAPRPNAGPNGPDGSAGKDGVLSVQQVASAAYWEQLRASLPENACERWARFRYDAGRYYYRSFVPGDPQRGGHLTLARDEFIAVTQLGSAELASAAAQQLAWIESGLNALGLSRTIAIKPDFEAFEQTYVQYTPLVEPLFRDAKTLIANAVGLKSIGDQLRTTATGVSGSLPSLEQDVKAAQATLARAQLNSNELDRQLSATQAQIAAAEADLRDATFALEGAGPESLAIGIFSLLFNIIPGVMAAQGVVGVLVKTNNDPSLRFLLGTDDRATPLGGLAFAIDELGLFWGLGQSQADIAAARIKGDEALIRELMTRLVTLIFERKRQELETTAADRHLDAAQARVAAAKDDLAALQQAVGVNVADLGAIAGVLERVLAATGRLGELIVRNVFLAARALDILSFANHTVVGSPSAPVSGGAADQLRLDFGVVHPDKVADATLELRRGGAGADRAARAGAALALLDELIANWSQAPEWIQYRAAWNELKQNLTTKTAWISVSAPALLQSLKQTGRAVLPIALDQLPAAATDLRIRSVRVVLIGATTAGAVPSVDAQMTHGGYAYVRRGSDGAELIVDGPALTDIVEVSTSSTALSSDAAFIERGDGDAGAALGGGVENVQRFFGRSPATTWRLDLRGPIGQGELALDGLSAVQIGISYDGIAAPMAKPPVAVGALAESSLLESSLS
jgi:hypothetical protein